MDRSVTDVISGCPLLCKEAKEGAEGPFSPGCVSCSNMPKYQKDAASVLESNSQSVIASDEIEFSDSPIEVRQSPLYGNYIVASRDIEEKELIFYDRAILAVPDVSAYHRYLCLSCYKKISRFERCSKCQWPVCSLKCEQSEVHRLNECAVFHRNSIRQDVSRGDCFCVLVIRCLKMRESAPQLWERILTLESHKTARHKNKKEMEALEYVIDFIHNECKLREYDKNVIDHIVGVLNVNCFAASDDVKKFATALFDQASLFVHECSPNTVRLTLVKSAESVPNRLLPSVTENCSSDSEILLEIYAARPIKKDELISVSYINPNIPVHERRLKLKKFYYFDCVCQMCSTEIIQASQSAQTKRKKKMACDLFEILSFFFFCGMVLWLLWLFWKSY